MSSRRSRTSRISENEINDLVYKLQTLIPELRRRRSSNRASASKILNETCNYIKCLHQEVDGLSERLSELLASMDGSSAEAEVIRSLLIQQQ